MQFFLCLFPVPLVADLTLPCILFALALPSANTGTRPANAFTLVLLTGQTRSVPGV